MSEVKEYKFYGLMEKDRDNDAVFFPAFKRFNHPNMIIGEEDLGVVAKESVKTLIAHFLESNLTIPISENFKDAEFVVTAHIINGEYRGSKFDFLSTKLPVEEVEQDIKIETTNPVESINIKKCARCGDDHDFLDIIPFTRSEKYSHFATCPKTREPILINITSS